MSDRLHYIDRASGTPSAVCKGDHSQTWLNNEPRADFKDNLTAKGFSIDDTPFFLHLCYTAPHYPLHAKPKDISKYRGMYTMGWEQMRKDRWVRQQKMGLTNDTWNLTQGDPKEYSWNKSDHDFEDERMAVYAAMIDRVDQNIGRIHKTLKATGQAGNTLILFLSDNGGCSEEPGGRDPSKRTAGPGDDYVAVGPSWGWAQNAPFRRYKSWVHEGGITTPMIAWWPDHVPANTINRSPAHIMDLLPTFLDLANTPYPRKYNGHDENRNACTSSSTLISRMSML